jgi:hypothetical protein
LKTHPRSSAVEEFCLTNNKMEKQAKQFLRDEQKITVTYSRPLWVNPFKCEATLSIAKSFQESSGVETP